MRTSLPTSLTLLLTCLLLVPGQLTGYTVLGAGPGALLGGDLTDPENDGNDATGSGFDWVSIDASSEEYYINEGAFNIFDNKVGAGDDKWCCEGAPQDIAVELDRPYILTHFTLAAGNDAAERDPTRWKIEGSNDGSTWTTIYDWDLGFSPFTNRLEVLRFNGDGQDFPTPAPYKWFRYNCTSTDAALHQINELELFGVATIVINDFTVDKPLIPTGDPVTLSWDVNPEVTNVTIDNGVGDVTAQTVGGIGTYLIDPGPVTTTSYTITAIHPEATANDSVTVTVTDQPIIQSFAATPPIIGPGDSSTLEWEVINAVTLDLNGADVTGESSLVVSPGSSANYTLTATNANGSTVAETAVLVVIPGQPVISEFMADNNGDLIVDEDGDNSDWIELHNPSATAANLEGYFLTDDPGDLQKWQFPAVSLDPLEYLVVFASSKNRIVPGAELHTSFALAAGGEYLALVAPDGVTIVSEFGLGGTNYPPQEEGVSFGNYGSPPQVGYFETATPGAENDNGFVGFVKDTSFSVNRGFYDTPQMVEITSATPGAQIRYTTDSSWPTPSSGILYTGPINIDRTTPLRAIAYKENHRSSNVDTQTYIFVDDVITQDSTITQNDYGLPASWNGTAPDYGMDPNVTGPYNATIRDDLRTVPSLSLVIDTDDMFGSSGIYSNPNGMGVSWERATSLELIDPANPDGSNDFQLNCGIRIHGGAFRSFGLTKKKSFRVLFKDIYGPTKLRYAMFGPTATDEFDTLVFRMESNDGYQWDNRTNVQYARDAFARKTQLDIGEPASHGRHLNLYINGVYWGIYNVVERPDASFGEQYFGADKDEWDGVNTGSPTNEGSISSWNSLNSILSAIPGAPNEAARTAIYMQAQGLNPDGSDNAAMADYIDIDNYINYLLVNYYTGNSDWPQRNYYHGRERDLLDPAPLNGSRTSIGTHFFCWDSEWTLFVGTNDPTGRTDNVCAPYGYMRSSQEFRVRFADLAHRALFNGGALTNEECQARYAEITKDHTSILVPELARWGDQHGTLRTIAQWSAEYNHIYFDWLGQRESQLVSILQGANLYPNLPAPVFSQHGGSVMPTTPVIMSTDASTLYYTTDGSDPRLLGGGISPDALNASFGGPGPGAMTFIDNGFVWNYRDLGTDPGPGWHTPAYDHSSWASGPSSLGYGTEGEGDGTTVSFGPDPNNKYATTYFRTTVNIPDPAIYDHILLRVKYDDALAFFVNGTAVVLTANLPNGVNSAFDQYATAQVTAENSYKDFVIPTNLFNAGENTLAAQVHQSGGGSSDIRFDVLLRGEVDSSGGANEADPLFFDENTMLSARSYNPTTMTWSALNQALLTVNVTEPDDTNLVISEFNYRPYEPILPAEIAISTDRDDYEYLELLNVGTTVLDLGGVRFDLGIDFSFPDETFLAPDARILIVGDLAAFTARYGSSPGGAVVAGQYSGSLSNDGEALLLVGPGGTIRSFTYNDQHPWPVSADGDGPSLVLVDPYALPDHGVATNWRASAAYGGVPGGNDSLSFEDWKTARGIADDEGDPDSDKLNNFGEFAMGTEFDMDSSGRMPQAFYFKVGEETHIGFNVRVSLAAMDDARLILESSAALDSWDDVTGEFTLTARLDHGDGTTTLTYQSDLPLPDELQYFFRVAFQFR